MAGEAHPLRGGRCERARQWVSLRIDDELTELEDALLQKHLEACGPCRSFAARLNATTELLRQTPQEQPQIEYAPRARRPAGFPVGRRVAIAAIAAAAALGSFVGSSLQKPAQEPAPASVPQVSFLTRDMAQLRQLPHQTKQPQPAPARVPGEPPEGVV